MIADRKGAVTGFALDNLQKRGELFVEPGVEVYEGMVIGEVSRPEPMVVNPTKAKELTNIRTHASDEAIKLKPPACSAWSWPSSGSPTTNWSR